MVDFTLSSLGSTGFKLGVSAIVRLSKSSVSISHLILFGLCVYVIYGYIGHSGNYHNANQDKLKRPQEFNICKSQSHLIEHTGIH